VVFISMDDRFMQTKGVDLDNYQGAFGGTRLKSRIYLSNSKSKSNY